MQNEVIWNQVRLSSVLFLFEQKSELSNMYIDISKCKYFFVLLLANGSVVKCLNDLRLSTFYL